MSCGAAPEVAEGEWPAGQRVVVVAFGSMDRLHQWHASAEYVAALTVRDAALRRRLLFVEGSEGAES